ncbi:MAG: hypothetical protein K6B13_11400 [Prevotella sp.]|nr:hypothetical protein [Prevotella sp.]
MAKYVLRELAEGMGSNNSALFPKIVSYTKFDNDEVVKTINRFSPAFGEGVIRGVLDGLTKALRIALPNGISMKIDGLGVFSLSLGFSDGHPDDGENGPSEEMKHKDSYRHVCAKGINFKVDPKFIKEVNQTSSFERAAKGVQRCKTATATFEQRRQRARQLISEHGYITLTDYVVANNMSRPMASRDLKRITSDPTSGIVAKGSHSHKIWVEKE